MVITTAYYKARNVKVNKAKSPYFKSVAGNGRLTNNTEADGALILTPSLQQCSVLRIFKAT